MANKKNFDREIGEMNMEIKNLKDTTNRIESKLDKFIDTAHAKYATKEELVRLKHDLDKQEIDIKWNKEKIFDILLKVATIGAIIGFGSKSIGLW